MIRRCRDEDLHPVYEVINEAAIVYKGAIPDDCWHEPYMPMDELQRGVVTMTFYGFEEDGRLVGVIGY